MKNKGFTLIELLVVIAILALLASIIFASLSNARDKANVRKAQVQADQIEKAIELSRLSNGSFPFSNTDTSVSIKNDPDTLSAIEEYYPSISNITLPKGSDFDGRDYYAFTENGVATAYNNDIDYERNVILKCDKDYFTGFDDYPNDQSNNYEEWRNLTSSWEADQSVVAYRKYQDWTPQPFVGCPTLLASTPNGRVDREYIKDQNIVYFYNDFSEPVPFWEVFDPYCGYVWLCK